MEDRNLLIPLSIRPAEVLPAIAFDIICNSWKGQDLLTDICSPSRHTLLLGFCLPSQMLQSFQVGMRISQQDPSSRRICAKWLRVQPPDGQAVRFNVEEVENKSNEW